MNSPSIVILLLFIFNSTAFSQSPIITTHQNLIYGITSGTALLMDVYQPSNSNHLGIMVIPGSSFGYSYPESYNQEQLKSDYYWDTAYIGKWSSMLVEKGYTVFVINHRFAPQFHYADIIADCQRAVRYVRFNAGKYGIDPYHLGALGHSSGANLCAILGVTDTGIEHAENKMDSLSSKVQAVVALAAPFDLSDFNKNGDTSVRKAFVLKMLESYMGELPAVAKGEFVLSGSYATASPIVHVTSDDAAFLIYYGDDDPIIPARQATAMYQKLVENKVPSKIFVKHHGQHSPVPDMEEVDKWFKKYLK
ncbi:MAG TPA: alpha/beta hydrolase [Chitinophagales bacterium]|nr:alpha/beta hydrolase [Chitinophagales bacterium]